MIKPQPPINRGIITSQSLAIPKLFLQAAEKIMKPRGMSVETQGRHLTKIVRDMTKNVKRRQKDCLDIGISEKKGL